MNRPNITSWPVPGPGLGPGTNRLGTKKPGTRLLRDHPGRVRGGSRFVEGEGDGCGAGDQQAGVGVGLVRGIQKFD